MMDVSIRIQAGDMLVIDGSAYRVMKTPEAGDEWQLAVPAGFTDAIYSPPEFEEKLAEAEHIQIHR